MTRKAAGQWKLWTGILLLGFFGTTAALVYMVVGSSTPLAQAEDGAHHVAEASSAEADVAAVPVTVVKARKGAMQRLSTQPGSVLAFESVDLFAKVSGFLKTQHVDIGDRVQKGQVLAVVDVPELEKQAQRDKAAVDQALAKVLQMKARIAVAQADLDAAKASVIQAEAKEKSSAAWVRFRGLQYQRMKDLFALKSIEEKLVDENKERYEASKETEQADRAAVSTTKAQVVARAAKILQAEADATAAEAEVQVVQAELEKVRVQVAFATIPAPFDGVVTFRSMFPGDFARAAGEGTHEPLLTVQRTDLMRVVVQVPDRDIPFTDPGDPAFVEFDALPGEPLLAKVSRTSNSEDPQTRLMHVEIDLPNPTGKIFQGMYGRVTIVLEKATDLVSIPSACLVGKTEGHKGNVYVVQDGHARLVPVRLGADNALRVIVLGGLKGDEEVVLQPGNALTEGTPVHPTFWDEAPTHSPVDH